MRRDELQAQLAVNESAASVLAQMHAIRKSRFFAAQAMTTGIWGRDITGLVKRVDPLARIKRRKAAFKVASIRATMRHQGRARPLPHEVRRAKRHEKAQTYKVLDWNEQGGIVIPSDPFAADAPGRRFEVKLLSSRSPTAAPSPGS